MGWLSISAKRTGDWNWRIAFIIFICGYSRKLQSNGKLWRDSVGFRPLSLQFRIGTYYQQPIRHESDARARVFSATCQGWSSCPTRNADQHYNSFLSFPITKIVLRLLIDSYFPPYLLYFILGLGGEENKDPIRVAVSWNNRFGPPNFDPKNQ